MIGWVRIGFTLGLRGSVNNFMFACFGVRPPLRELHLRQQQTTFSQVVGPPWLLGTTWSTLNWFEGLSWPQYWHLKLSRAEQVLAI